MRRARTALRREPTIALINIVFLMLVFFMVAGTLTQPLDKGVTLVRTSALEGRPPPDALVIHADGAMAYRGDALMDAAALPLLGAAETPEIRLVPDRDLPAADLVRIARQLRAAGAGRILIVTEKGLE